MFFSGESSLKKKMRKEEARTEKKMTNDDEANEKNTKEATSDR